MIGAGCGKSSNSDDSGSGLTNSAQDVYTTSAASGDIDKFSWNLPNGEPTSLDWILDYGDSENTVLANLCEGLQRQNPDFSITDGLALFKRVDPLTFVYTIRSGVKFTDGNPLTAEDVAFSLNRNLDPALGSYWASPFYNSVKSIKVTGDNEVTVKLKTPDALFNRMMATAAGVIGEKKYVEKKGDSYGTPTGGVMCTGPYSLESWKPGSEIVLKKNPNYWDQDLQPKADEVDFQFVTDESTASSALVSGSIDGTFEVPQASVPQLQSGGKGKLTFGAGTQFVGVRQTETKGLLTNPKIREALSLAMNRDAIAKVIFNGSSVPAMTPVQPAQWGYSKPIFEAAQQKLPKPTQDLTKAKDLVKQAGSPTDPIVIAVSADQSYMSQTAQTIKSAAKEVGLNVEVKGLSTDVFNNLYYDAKARSAYDAFLVQEYGAGVADPIVTLSEFTPLSDYNYGNLNIPAVTNSIRKAIATYDDDQRADYVTTAQAALVDQLGVITVGNQLNSVYQGSKITGAPASLAFLYYPWAAGVGAP
ncbi:MAG: ABC transporter substrate-binding protein [Thermoleophilia bacterium]|nr:ABC transporter substrate-binding protein [Thermoleophilia bacterium]